MSRAAVALPRTVWALATAVAALVLGTPKSALAQVATPSPGTSSAAPVPSALPAPMVNAQPAAVPYAPRYGYVSDDENWRPLCDPARRGGDPFDPLKCIRLGGGANRYVSLGGGVRLRYEHYVDKQWNPLLGSNGYLLQRELLHADLHLDRLRAYAELEHAVASAARAPADPTWRDDFAATSAFVEYDVGGATGASAAPPLAIRLGRQQLAYGSQRTIDNRGGLNTIQSFDGVRLRLDQRGWRTDVFWTRPVSVAPYGFDDRPTTTRSFFGGYATRALRGGSLDFYALGDQRGAMTYFRGTQPETRYSLGTRYAVGGPHLDADTELTWQVGSFGGAAIDALALEINAGYAWSFGRNRVRLGLGGGLATGDHGPPGSRLTLYRAPYPTGLTFGVVQANGNSDTAGFAPGLTYVYHDKLTVAAKSYFYYRQSLSDGIYAPAGIPLRAPAGSRAAPVGNLGYTALSDALGRHASLVAAYARYLTGGFLRDSGPAKGVPSAGTAYFSTALEYKF